MTLSNRGPEDKFNLALPVPQELNPENLTIRMMGVNDSLLFCLRDLCRVCGDIRIDSAKKSLDAEDQQKVKWQTLGGVQDLTFVTEAGFYQVVMTSRSSRVKPFRLWVTREVLPCIRRYGCYPAPPPKSQRSVAIKYWSERLRTTVLDHHRHILQKIGKSHWSVFTVLQTHMLIAEDEFVRHNLPVKQTDLPDGSAGQMWSKHREGKPWAQPFHFAPLEMPGRLMPNGQNFVADVKVYDPSELTHFQFWFFNEYLPNHLPKYLRNKESLKSTGLSPASAADHINLTTHGTPATLLAKERAGLTAAGGFIPYVPRISGS
jgi:prophage antirepressor-like protein